LNTLNASANGRVPSLRCAPARISEAIDDGITLIVA
jgi:hypothetical protein